MNKATRERITAIIKKAHFYRFKDGCELIAWVNIYGAIDSYSLRHGNGDVIKVHYKLSEILDICGDEN